MADQNTDTHQSSTAGIETEIPAKKNILSLVASWPLNRKIALGAALVLSIAIFTVIILQSRTVNQQLLYANLSATDAAQVTEWLQAQKIPYSLKDGAKSIWIPVDNIYQTRLDLAANGLPSGGGVGFEIFDKQSFALTDYVQKVNYSRALQGELARTVSSLAPVEATRVHLAIPEKRLFKSQQQATTASVIITLVPGKSLSDEQVQGIIHLVAGSVGGLEPEHVKVIDSNGMVLGNEDKQDHLLSTDMLAYQREVERQMQLRAQDLLDRTMGVDNALVRVTATLDFSQVEKTEELYDGDDPVIRSEQINSESNTTKTNGGIPGVESNLENDPRQDASVGEASSKNARTTNYEISKTVSRIINPVGTITQLSVSVLVSDRTKRNNETQEVETTPRTKQELKTIQDMVSSAIGIVVDRGDIITVTSMPFMEKPEPLGVGSQSTSETIRDFYPFIKYILLFIAFLLLYLFLVRPIVKTLKGEVQQHNKTVEEMEREQQRRKQQEDQKRDINPMPPVDQALAELRASIMQENAATTFIIKNWIHEGN